jgi:hypothetical protein
MFMFCLYIKLHTYNFKDSLFITVKPKTKFRFREAAILLVYILHFMLQMCPMVDDILLDKISVLCFK